MDVAYSKRLLISHFRYAFTDHAELTVSLSCFLYGNKDVIKSSSFSTSCLLCIAVGMLFLFAKVLHNLAATNRHVNLYQFLLRLPEIVLISFDCASVAN